ncbi:hypothetical protein ACLBKS_02160 [Hylemonella sp. W303a]|uniref:hypothetical protein n=1 Tax=Hylemonella sp. W303a TaxID=3389873 RepID=UPI00396B281F
MTAAIQHVRLRDVEHYTNRRYIVDSFDCVDLAVDVQREVFGREVRIPVHPRGKKSQAVAISRYANACTRLLSEPETGCIALMRGQEGRWHIGTVVMNSAGTPWLLHAHSTELGVLLQPLAEVGELGLRVVEFREWL